jgi:hypothetical protein
MARLISTLSSRADCWRRDCQRQGSSSEAERNVCTPTHSDLPSRALLATAADVVEWRVESVCSTTTTRTRTLSRSVGGHTQEFANFNIVSGFFGCLTSRRRDGILPRPARTFAGRQHRGEPAQLGRKGRWVNADRPGAPRCGSRRKVQGHVPMPVQPQSLQDVTLGRFRA